MLILSGKIGHEEAWWMSATILAISILSFLIVLSVPDHFLEKHLWNHVFKKHVPKIFLWAFAALFITHLLIHDIKMENMVLNAKWSVLFLAAIAGLIPQSGPHLIFVTLFAKGLLPFSVLLANSIVQDGHGTLPLLAHSRKDFIVIKTVKLVISLFICSVLMLMGF